MVLVEIQEDVSHNAPVSDEDEPPSIDCSQFRQSNDLKEEQKEEKEPVHEIILPNRNNELNDAKDTKQAKEGSSSYIMRRTNYCLIQAESERVQNLTIDQCLASLRQNSYTGKITFCTRWKYICFTEPYFIVHRPSESFSQIVLSVGKANCSTEGTTSFYCLNVTQQNYQNVVDEFLKTLLESFELKQPFTHGFTTKGDLSVQQYHDIQKIPFSNEVQHVYTLLTGLKWSLRHSFGACILETKLHWYSIQISNSILSLYPTKVYERWQAIRDLIESKDLNGFLFWLHRLFSFNVPLA